MNNLFTKISERKYLLLLVLLPTIICDLGFWYLFNHNYFDKINLNEVFYGIQEHIKYLPNVPHNLFIPMILALIINVIFIAIIGSILIKSDKIFYKKTLNKFILTLSIKLIIILALQYLSWYFVICKKDIGDIENQVIAYTNTFKIIKIFMLSYYIPIIILLVKHKDKN